MQGIKGRKKVFVEFDPPKDGVPVEQYISLAKSVYEAGADVITLADCPGAKLRGDAFITTALLCREGISVLPHMTCRDRNLLSMQSVALSLRSLNAVGILAVTGDRIKQQGDYKAVYHMNSVTAIKKLKETVNVFCAVNIAATNFAAEKEKAVRKRDAGAAGFFTQPVLSAEAFENLKELRQLGVKVYVGILPVVSFNNACFLDENIAGIKVCDSIKQRLSGLDRQRGEELAVDMSARIAAAVDEYADGFYIITPLDRASVVIRLMERMRADGLI